MKVDGSVSARTDRGVDLDEERPRAHPIADVNLFSVRLAEDGSIVDQ